jgi:hypothetical protein
LGLSATFQVLILPHAQLAFSKQWQTMILSPRDCGLFMRALPHQALLPLEPAGDADVWVERLSRTFDDTSRHTGFLELAESAVDACPGNPIVLTLAATAALLDDRPERALVFLKRISKRYSATPTDHLLRALRCSKMENGWRPGRYWNATG